MKLVPMPHLRTDENGAAMIWATIVVMLGGLSALALYADSHRR